MFGIRESSGAWVDVNVVNLDIVLEYLSGENRGNEKPYTRALCGQNMNRPPTYLSTFNLLT